MVSRDSFSCVLSRRCCILYFSLVYLYRECGSKSTQKLRFLISDAPTEKNLEKYIKVIVRVDCIMVRSSQDVTSFRATVLRDKAVSWDKCGRDVIIFLV